MLHRTEAALATQPAVPGDADIQQVIAQLIQAAAYRVAQSSLRILQHIQQTWQLDNRHFTIYLLAISGKIQAIDERPCVHEARMIYFSPLRVKSHGKNPKEYR
jgi:hypothetical protein